MHYLIIVTAVLVALAYPGLSSPIERQGESEEEMLSSLLAATGDQLADDAGSQKIDVPSKRYSQAYFSRWRGRTMDHSAAQQLLRRLLNKRGFRTMKRSGDVDSSLDDLISTDAFLPDSNVFLIIPGQIDDQVLSDARGDVNIE